MINFDTLFDTVELTETLKREAARNEVLSDDILSNSHQQEEGEAD